MADSFKKEIKQPVETKTNARSSIGLDQDEQHMNGMYGMVETKEEDQLSSKTLTEPC